MNHMSLKKRVIHALLYRLTVDHTIHEHNIQSRCHVNFFLLARRTKQITYRDTDYGFAKNDEELNVIKLWIMIV
jgi:hypothetical protein